MRATKGLTRTGKGVLFGGSQHYEHEQSSRAHSDKHVGAGQVKVCFASSKGGFGGQSSSTKKPGNQVSFL